MEAKRAILKLITTLTKNTLVFFLFVAAGSGVLFVALAFKERHVLPLVGGLIAGSLALFFYLMWKSVAGRSPRAPLRPFRTPKATPPNFPTIIKFKQDEH